jgi:3-oxoacyl-[acyl-carrier-protein] synthase III
MSRAPLLAARIAGTGSVPAGPAVPTAEVVARVAGPWDAAEVARRTGIASRAFAPPDVGCAALGAQALRAALDAAALDARALDRLVFVSSLGGDVLAPATANLVAAELGLASSCDCFDLNNACMGFLSALDVAARGVATGQRAIGIVVVDLTSRFITPDDPRPFLVFGDFVAAAVVAPATGDEGVLGVVLRNDGTNPGEVTVAHPGLTGRRETIRFASSNARMAELALALFRRGVDDVLAQAGLDLAEIDWVVPHQPNGAMLATIVEELGLDRSRIVPVVHEVGSVGAASIPLGLDRLMRSGRVRPGHRILLVGVGAGLSSGAIVLRVGA